MRRDTGTELNRNATWSSAVDRVLAVCRELLTYGTDVGSTPSLLSCTTSWTPRPE